MEREQMPGGGRLGVGGGRDGGLVGGGRWFGVEGGDRIGRWRLVEGRAGRRREEDGLRGGRGWELVGSEGRNRNSWAGRHRKGHN